MPKEDERIERILEFVHLVKVLSLRLRRAKTRRRYVDILGWSITDALSAPR